MIYLALLGPAAALPALLMLDRLERWAAGGSPRAGQPHQGPAAVVVRSGRHRAR